MYPKLGNERLWHTLYLQQWLSRARLLCIIYLHAPSHGPWHEFFSLFLLAHCLVLFSHTHLLTPYSLSRLPGTPTISRMQLTKLLFNRQKWLPTRVFAPAFILPSQKKNLLSPLSSTNSKLKCRRLTNQPVCHLFLYLLISYSVVLATVVLVSFLGVCLLGGGVRGRANRITPHTIVNLFTSTHAQKIRKNRETVAILIKDSLCFCLWFLYLSQAAYLWWCDSTFVLKRERNVHKASRSGRFQVLCSAHWDKWLWPQVQRHYWTEWQRQIQHSGCHLLSPWYLQPLTGEVLTITAMRIVWFLWGEMHRALYSTHALVAENWFILPATLILQLWNPIVTRSDNYWTQDKIFALEPTQ